METCADQVPECPASHRDLIRLVETSGVELFRQGAVWVGKCPFHADQGQALLVDPRNGHWQCDGDCQTGGTAVEWIMKREGVSRAHATELLRQEGLSGASSVPGTPEQPPTGTLETPFSSEDDDQTVLRRIFDFYHQTLLQSPEALTYLKDRRIDSPEAIKHFNLGFSNRTLGYHLPERNRKEGAALRGRLQRLGILRSSGHEHFRGSVVVPIISRGQVDQAYGRKVTPNLRPGTPLHVFLPGDHKGIFNLDAVETSEELIVCQSVLDALTFWCAGYRNVTCTYGLDGFRDELADALIRLATARVLVAYRASPEGDRAASLFGARIQDGGIDSYRIEFPPGLDANAYAVQSSSPSDALGERIRKSVWLAKGTSSVAQPDSASMVPVLPEPDNEARSLTSAESAPTEPTPEPTVHTVEAQDQDDLTVPEEQEILPATVLPEAPADLAIDVDAHELALVSENRRYRVRGLEKNVTYDQLKINLLVSCGDALHVDSFDLYATRRRAAFTSQAAQELGVDQSVIKKDLARLLLQLEILQERTLPEHGAPKRAVRELDEHDRAEAMAFLKCPNLVDRILEDYQRCGLVGEETNKLVAYLAAVSRKLEKPLAVMIQSTSAAGKSALMETTLGFVPQEEQVHYSAMTGKSLFYMGDIDLRHKILAISEEEGAASAAYAMRLLQSEGHLTIASTGKDAFSGKHVTHEYRVEGPVVIMSTSTAIDIDEELLNRCIVLTIDENRRQTQAIHDRQRYEETLEGLLAHQGLEHVLRLHRNAQRLLRPVNIVNPYADRLTFLCDKTRTRRDHRKYLALIRSVALLHQYQREVKTAYSAGRPLEYIEVTLDDVELANRIAHEVLGRSLDEMPPQTRQLLGLVYDMVRENSAAEDVSHQDYRFSRRDVREYTGWGLTQLKVHLQRLEALEYLLIHKGGRGQRIVYELLYNGEGQDGSAFFMGLIDPEALRDLAVHDSESADSAGESVRGRGHVGQLSGPCRMRGETPKASTGKASTPSAGVSEGNSSP